MSTSSVVFPNGETLVSSANTPDSINLVFQALFASCLGIDPALDPSAAFSTVRVAWQPKGQPAWGIKDNICVVRSVPVDSPFARVRDAIYDQNNPSSLTSNMGFTQIWNIHGTLYGPNAYDNARTILSAMALEWTHDSLAASNIYLVVGPKRPVFTGENFEGQWWKRADIDVQFNELVLESIGVSAAASADINLLTDSGYSQEIKVSQI